MTKNGKDIREYLEKFQNDVSLGFEECSHKYSQNHVFVASIGQIFSEYIVAQNGTSNFTIQMIAILIR